MQADILTSIQPALLVLIPILYAIAEMIKITPVKHWKIPFILWGISVGMTIIFLFVEKISVQNIFVGITQGTLIAMMTVGGNQFIKQATVNRKCENTEKPKGNDNL